jgi:hypothetical protein
MITLVVLLAADSLAGRWCGSATVHNDFVSQATIEVVLDIQPTRAVTGRVGDATIVDARLDRNRGVLGRLLGIKTDWIVRGKLRGPLIVADDVDRGAFTIPLSIRVTGRAVELSGTVHATGAGAGSRHAAPVAASPLVLTRCALDVAPP